MGQLSELRDDLRTKLGSPNIADVPEIALTRIINEAYREIGTKFPFHETRCISSMSTVIGQQRYNLPTDAAVVRKVWNATTGRALRKSGISTIAGLRGTANGGPYAGSATRYIRAGRYIELVPTPNAVETIYIYYHTHVASLVEDTDRPVLPESWHPGIIQLARYKWWDERGDMAKATYAYQAYKLWLSDKPSEIDQEKVDMDEAVQLPELAHGYSYRGWGRDTIYNDCWRTAD